MNPHIELDQIALTLGEDELRVLVEIARRLKMGQGQYGSLRLARDRRDFKHEAAEELLDATVYLTCRALSGSPGVRNGRKRR